MSAEGCTVLVVEDDPASLAAVERLLRDRGFRVVTATTAADALQAATRLELDVAVVDLGLPDQSGRQLVAAWAPSDRFPILILSGQGLAARDRTPLLRLGADDYVVKPADPDELALRVAGLVKRKRRERPSAYEYGNLVVDLLRREARVSDRRVPLTASEWAVLVELAASCDRVVAYGTLALRTRGAEGSLHVDAMLNHARRMIRKLRNAGLEGVDIVNRSKQGYMLQRARTSPAAATVGS